MSFSVITGALGSAVAPNGTFTAAYPSGKDSGAFFLAVGHKLTVGSDVYYYPVDFDITLGATSATVTNKTSAITWPSGAVTRLQLEEAGERAQLTLQIQSPNAQVGTIAVTQYSINTKAKLVPTTYDTYLDLITLGAPVALSTNAIALAQSAAGAGSLTLNGALVSGGIATLDQPRAVQAVSTGADTAVLTVKGLDVYGFSLSEALTLNGATAVLGKKAFKTISAITNGAAIANLASVGTTDILGLPLFVPAAGMILAELQSGNKIGGGGGSTFIDFSMNDTELATPISKFLVSPVGGFVQSVRVTTDRTIVTGGDMTANIGATPITGLNLSLANSAAPGATAVARPTTPFSATTVVVPGSVISIIPGTTWATSGAINGTVEIVGAASGTFVAGTRTAGGATTTTGDVRGTYKPPIACDGVTVWQLLVSNTDRFAGQTQNLSA